MVIDLNKYLDHTLLRPDATLEEVRQLCREGVEYDVAAVYLNPAWVPYGKEALKGTKVKLGSVVGFPLGATSCKAQEAAELVSAGAEEIDMVLAIGALKSRMYDRVQEEIAAVVRSVPGVLVKVILETCLLTDEEKCIAAKIVVAAGGRYVKTSTGFSKAGATVEDVALLREVVGSDIGVKASGGIRDRTTALAMIDAGATRIGTSSSLAILQTA